jgi:hypothetical protein
MSKQTFFKVRKSKILIFLSSFRKSANFLGSPVRQNANPKIFMINPQNANPQVSTKYSTTLSHKSPKSRLLHDHYVQIVIGALYATFVRGKVMYST